MSSNERHLLKRHSVALPAVTLTLSSAASMALEIVAGRALAPYVGMSLYSWTVIIAVVLAGLSLGHWIGGLISGDGTGAPRKIALALAGAATSCLLTLPIVRATAPLFAESDPVSHVGALSLAAFFLPSVLAGLVSPLLTLLAQNAAPPEQHGRVLGLMFALGALGAIIGTLVAGLVMISWLGTAGSVTLIAGVYALLSLGYWRGAMRAGAAAIVALIAILSAAGATLLARTGPCLEESAYFCIRVDPVAELGRPAKVMALDHLVHGVNDREDPRLLLSPYVHGVDELIAERFKEPSFSAFFIGGGAYTLPRAWRARYPSGRLEIAELDPTVTRIAVEQLWFAPDAETLIHHGDARRVLNQLPSDKRFDVIFGDAFHDISVPQHLATDEFHLLVSDRLTTNGVYVMNVVDALREPRFVLSLATTLRNRFEHVELWLDVAAIQPNEARTTWIVLASATPSAKDHVSARYGLVRDWVRVPLADMVNTVGEDRIIFLTDDYAPVDRLLSKVLLDASLSEAAER